MIKLIKISIIYDLILQKENQPLFQTDKAIATICQSFITLSWVQLSFLFLSINYLDKAGLFVN